MVDTYNRKAKWIELKPYCHHSGENSFLEVVEWGNEEGFDVLIEGKNRSERVSMTWGQWDALLMLVSYREEKK